jgi:hypothetical protein
MEEINMEMKIVGITVAILVSITLLAGVLMPVLDDATATTDTFSNDGYFTYDAINDDTDLTITWAVATPGAVTVGDKTITMPSGAGNWTIVGSTNFTMRYYSGSSATGLQCYGSAGYLSANDVNAVSATITINSTSMVFSRTGTDGTTVTSTTFPMGNHGFVVNGEGKGALTLKYSDQAAYVLNDSDIYLCGTTFVTGSGTNDFVGVFGYGSIDDGVTLSSFYGNTGQNTVSFGTPTITYTEDPDHIDLYQISKVDFALTQNAATVDATYSYFVVPTEVTAERSVHFTDNENAIFAVIPVLVIIAILVGVVALVLRSRMD